MNEPDIPEDLKRLRKHLSEERTRLGKDRAEEVERLQTQVVKENPASPGPNAEKIPDTQPIQGDVVPEDNPQEPQNPD